MRTLASWLVAIGVAACGGSSPQPPDSNTSQTLPAWDPTLPDASVIGAPRGLQPSRGIVHLHSPYSHDACDEMPRDANGVPNEPCLQDLRRALCVDKIDFAALTDHDASMADEDFPTLFSMRGNDVAIPDASGNQIASKMTCDDGHQVVITVGSENDLMPIMLDRHVTAATVQERHDIYNADTAAAMAAYRDAGGLGWIAHTEQHELAELDAVLPDGIEVYNLHANIDPDIRRDYLGLPADGAISAALQFADTADGHPEPDLALLGFLDENQPAIARWNALLAEGKHIPATAGSDAHQNALPVILADGERGDSYRRVLRWFSNIVYVTDPHDPVQIKAALQAGRMFAVFELLGTPSNFNAYADDGAGAELPLGSQIAATSPSTFVLDVPTVRNLDPSLPAPEVRAKILHVDATGEHEVASGAGPQLSVSMEPGAYRAVVYMTPHHLGPYLGTTLGPGYAEREIPWIYTSPIYVGP